MHTTHLVFSYLWEEAAKFGADVSGAGTWWTIVSAMGSFIVAQFAYIKKMHRDLKTCQETRIKALEDKLAMVRAVKKSVLGSKIVKPPAAEESTTGDLAG